MQRDSSAYLNDILEAASAIQDATAGIDESTYSATRHSPAARQANMT